MQMQYVSTRPTTSEIRAMGGCETLFKRVGDQQ